MAALHLAELRHSSESMTQEQRLESSGQKQRFVLGIVSVGVGIPITAITATTVHPGLLGVAVAWGGIVAVNSVLPSGFVPNEDQGMIYAIIQTPPGTTLERAPLEHLAAAGQLRAFHHRGFWECMDTHKDWITLNELWGDGRAPWVPN